MKKIVILLAAMLAGAPAHGAGNPDKGAAKAKAICAACHGENGDRPASPDFPRLAGQRYDYLVKALSDYRSGARKNPVMGGQASNLSAEEVVDLSAFFASRKGALHVTH